MVYKVLIVDDNLDDRLAIKRNLMRAGKDATVIEAESGKQGLEMIQSGSFDCVFLDYMLPDMDGIRVLREIYELQSGQMPCPIVMLTGQGSESVMIDAIRYGTHDYLVKNNITTDTLYIAMNKAQQMYELKKGRNQDEKALFQTQIMEAVRQITGGVAHNFNDLLTIISGNTRLLMQLIDGPDNDTEAQRQKVETIQETTQRGADLVKQMMIFSCQKTLVPEVVNVNDVIAGMNDHLQRLLGKMVEIKIAFADDLWKINIDPIVLEYALINLGVNVRDAMLDGGTLSIETKNITIDKDTLPKIDVMPGSYVMLIISGTGMDIPEDIQQKTFEPFFTTKKVGKGTGLGLFMAYSFIKDSGGAIHVCSKQDQVGSFCLYLPKAEEQSG